MRLLKMSTECSCRLIVEKNSLQAFGITFIWNDPKRIEVIGTRQRTSMLRLSFIMFLMPALFTSCSQFQTGRSYLTEMEQDDSRYYNPQDDFPIVGGDADNYHNTEKDVRRRTPASEEDRANDLAARSLRSELKGLEQLQSKDSLDFYDQHKHQLVTTSEKIYYLKLHPRERRDYLVTRGFIQEASEPLAFMNSRNHRRQDNLLGMRKNDVVSSLGKPARVEIAGNPRNENERWLYKMNGASKYIYFESGAVQGWE